MLGVAFFLALSSYLSRRSLAKVAELLRLSAQALHQTPALLSLLLVLQLAMGLAVVLLGGGMGVSLANGRAVPNPEGAVGRAGRCVPLSVIVALSLNTGFFLERQHLTVCIFLCPL